MAVSLRYVGRVAYKPCLVLQEKLAEKYVDKQQPKVGELVVCEHEPPVFTFGLREHDYEQKAAQLRELGAEAIKVRRGGLTTFHGPGQLVCYPILNLHRLKIGIRQYFSMLEGAIINTCSQVDVKAHCTEHTGVWVGERKLCAIGVQVSKGVCYHGLALNCSVDLSWYEHIVPCGLHNRQVTSLTQILGKEVSVEEMAPLLVDCLTQSLGVGVISDD